ncbi:MAG: hypothetical protein LBP39_01340, partial [Rickettsiales bacterium]|nr:hypothetical protein [Rickettsiales bacterium]
MKISKKLNYSKALSSYFFLGTLAIFIGLGVGTCLASAVDVNNFSKLEEAIGDNSSSTINIKADSITLGQELPVINRSLTISGEAGGSILNGNDKYKILTFSKDSDDINISNIHFQNGHSNDPTNNQGSYTFTKQSGSIIDPFSSNGGGSVLIKEGTTIAFNNTNFSNNTALYNGGAICSEGNIHNKSTLRFNVKTTFSGNKSNDGNGGAIAVAHSNLIFGGETKFENNKSSDSGGAIFLHSPNGGGSLVIFEGTASFSGNRGGDYAGAIFSLGSHDKEKNIFVFNGKTTFS